jgi:hypothetical protein
MGATLEDDEGGGWRGRIHGDGDMEEEDEREEEEEEMSHER